MTYTAHTETDDATGLTLQIIADTGPTDSPLEYDEAIHFAVLHRRYVNPAAKAGLTTQDSIEAFAVENRRTWAAFPLYLYDHSGSTYRAAREDRNPFTGRLPQGHAEFDSGRVGSIFVNFEAVGCKKSWPKAKKLERAFEQAQSFCETYTSWANGEIYGYVIEDADGDHLDSCWGFIGAPDGYVLTEGREAFAAEIKAAKETAATAQALADTAAARALEAARPDLYQEA